MPAATLTTTYHSALDRDRGVRVFALDFAGVRRPCRRVKRRLLAWLDDQVGHLAPIVVVHDGTETSKAHAEQVAADLSSRRVRVWPEGRWRARPRDGKRVKDYRFDEAPTYRYELLTVYASVTVEGPDETARKEAKRCRSKKR